MDTNRCGLFDSVLAGATIADKLAWLVDLGYNAVEAMCPSISPDPDAYFACCRRHDITISCVTGVWLGDGVSPDAALRRAQLQVHKQYIDLTAQSGCGRYIFVDHLPKDAGADPDVVRATFCETLTELADYAGERGVTIILEAIVRRFHPVLDTVQSAAAFVREFGHPAVKMMVDSYHMAANGEDLEADTAAALDVCAHVHVSDYQAPPAEPERPYPGDGQVDFAAYLRPIVASGFAGPIIFEGSIVGDAAACLVRTREHIEQVLTALRG